MVSVSVALFSASKELLCADSAALDPLQPRQAYSLSMDFRECGFDHATANRIRYFQVAAYAK